MIDGEIVCLDKNGCPQFYDLLMRRAKPCFVAFDLLASNGKDLRQERLLDRKHELRRIIGGGSVLIYADHVEETALHCLRKLAS